MRKVEIVKKIRSISCVLMFLGYAFIAYLTPTVAVYADGELRSFSLSADSYFNGILLCGFAVALFSLIFVISSIYVFRNEG